MHRFLNFFEKSVHFYRTVMKQPEVCPCSKAFQQIIKDGQTISLTVLQDFYGDIMKNISLSNK